MGCRFKSCFQHHWEICPDFCSYGLNKYRKYQFLKEVGIFLLMMILILLMLMVKWSQDFQQLLDLEEVVPNFKIANATIHFDESIPHLHIVGVSFKDGMKNGMEKQVGKSDVFTRVSLKNIQDKMRIYYINSFNRIYHLNYILK